MDYKLNNADRNFRLLVRCKFIHFDSKLLVLARRVDRKTPLSYSNFRENKRIVRNEG